MNGDSARLACEPIAIVGLGCNFPGEAHGPAAYWTLLCNGVNAITEVPADRWSLDAFHSDNPSSPGQATMRFGGFIGDVDKFDCRFFGLSPREAARMDPQQRLLLQTTWEAFEDAGIRVDTLGGSSVGVFVGISYCDYAGIQGRCLNAVDGHTGTGSALSMAASRISHRLGFCGPSMAIDTACSSSLVAVNLACQNLWTDQCLIAVAGGINIILSPEITVYLSKAAMLSPDGQCRTFDARANGYVRGEGAGMIILKPLSRALADGDRIYAVIRASVTNQDGHTQSLTEPSGAAQEALMREACRRAGIPPRAVAYVEAHGTGTPVGDPIEASAIAAAYTREREDNLYVGSAKTNIGHLESASGIAGLIKAVLCIHHRALPPNLHYVTPNPAIDFDSLKLRVPTELTPLTARDGSIVVGVNSFGFGGTNAHVLLCEPADRPVRRYNPKAKPAGPLIIPISAASESGLRAVAARLADHIEGAGSNLSLPEVASTLATRRSHLDVRALVEAESLSELRDRLAALSAGDNSVALGSGKRVAERACVFVFCGQGSQWPGMGRVLMAEEPAFHRAIERVDRLFSPLSGWSLAEAISDDATVRRLGHTEIAQPLIFAVQVALVALWRSWGVQPSAVLGHSMGEIAAAYASGGLSLQDAVKVIYHRARLQQNLHDRGRMVATEVPFEDARLLLQTQGSDVAIAAVNSPGSVTLAGEESALEEFCSHLREQKISWTPLNIDYAFHSSQMEPLRDELLRSLRDIRTGKPKIPMISSVTGSPVKKGELNADYWWRNVRCMVRFSEAINHLIGEGRRVFLEVGPHPTMAGAILECLDSTGKAGSVLQSIYRNRPEVVSMRTSLARLYCLGLEPNWKAFLASSYRLASLPTYPWQQESCWQEEEESRDFRFASPVHPLLGVRQRAPDPVWLAEINLNGIPFLVDHRLSQDTVYPGAAYMEAMFAVARLVIDDGPCELVDVRFSETLYLEADRPVVLMTRFLPDRSIVEIHSRIRGKQEWTLNAWAKVRRCVSRVVALTRPPVPAGAGIGPEQFYGALEQEDAQFGPSFRGVERLWQTKGEVYFDAKLTQEAERGAAEFLFHPTLLDSCLQGARGLLPFEIDPVRRVGQIPMQAELVRFVKTPSRRISCHLRERRADKQTLLADMDVFDDEGEVVATFRGLGYRRFSRPVGREGGTEYYRSEWRARPLAAKDEEARSDGLWLVFADRGGVAERLATSLEQRGARCLRVFTGEGFCQTAPDLVTLRPESPADLEQLFGTLGDDAGNVSGFIHLWSLDCAPPTELTPECLDDAQRIGCVSVFHLVQTILQARMLELDIVPKLWLVTSGTQRLHCDDENDSPEIAVAQGALWGLARVIVNELPQLECRIVDLDAEGDEIPSLLREIAGGDQEPEIAWRRGERFVNRFVPLRHDTLPVRVALSPKEDETMPFRLEMPVPGIIDRLVLRQIAPSNPGPGEVRIDVQAAGLNFRDVMAVLGLLPDEAEESPAWQMLGLECAGIVTRIGTGVMDRRVGDRVVVSTRGAFASQFVVPAAQTLVIGEAISFEEAATLPVAFSTADIAINRFGRIAPGEKILIHAASGGVGLAAIQLCQSVDAEIFATAGSREKRDYLRSLGIRHTFDSRRLAFADQVMAATGGTGVDIVLNSLSGEFLDRSLEILAPFGRFLEIGKVDIYRDRPIGMAPFRRNIQFHGIDVGEILRERPDIGRETLERLKDMLAKGRIRPLPTTVFPISQAAQAFNHVAKARHIGKVVLSMKDKAVRVAAPDGSRFQFRPDASYLVTGGTSGFGLKVAEWMVGQGARHLTLASRRGRPGKEAVDILERLRKASAEIRVVSADVSDIVAVRNVIDEIMRTGSPLRGIAHAAARFDDDMLFKLNQDRFKAVLAPKVAGGWNLHLATRTIPIDFFLLFSSLSADLGAPGQAHYAAANSFLNILARHRKQLGLPVLAINWGAIGGAGFVARNQEVASHLGRLGVEQIEVDDALQALEDIIGRDLDEVVVAKINWEQLAATSRDMSIRHRLSPMLKGLQEVGEHYRALIRNELMSMDPEQAHQLLLRLLRQEVARVLKISLGEVDPDRPLDEIGLDSLTAFELKNRLETHISLKVPLSKFRQRPTIEGLVSLILDLHVKAEESVASAVDVDVRHEMPSIAE